MKNISFLILFLIAFSNICLAQPGQIKFEHISIEDGLSQSNVTCIFQDSDGFVWFGTWDGLNKFDGYKITVYRYNPDDANSISDNYINTIYEDNTGAIWVGTRGNGLCRYNKRQDNFATILHNPRNKQSLTSNNVKAIFQDSRGILWIGTNNGLTKILRKGVIDPALGETTDSLFVANHEVSGDDDALVIDGDEVMDDDQGASEIKYVDGGEIHVFDGVGEIVLKDNDDIDEMPINQVPESSDEVTKAESEKKESKDSLFFVQYRHNSEIPNGLSSSNINCISEAPNGNILIGTDNGLNEFDPRIEKALSFKYVLMDENNNIDEIYDIYKTKKHNIWVGTNHGLKFVDTQTGEITTYKHEQGNKNSLSDNIITSILEDKSGVIWVGTENGGLNRFNAQDTTFFTYKNEPSDPFSLSVDNVKVLYQDKTGTFWVGTSLGGINKWDRTAGGFELYRKNPFDKNSLTSNQIRTIYQDRAGIMWIGTVDAGLNVWNVYTNEITHYQHNPHNPNSLSHNHVRTVLEDAEGNFWIGTDGGGLDYFNPILGKFRHYRYSKNDPYSLGNNRVWKVYIDRQGRLWVATFGGGLNLFDESTNTFIRYRHIPGNEESLSNDKVTTIFEDHLGTLWVGTFGGGLNRWDEENQAFVRYINIKNEATSLGDNRIYSIIEDYDGTLWIGTKGNLNKFDRATSKFDRYGIEEGLPNNVIMGILEDEGGNLWISTNNGIAKFNKEEEIVRNYDVKNGLQSNEFLVGSFYKTSDGKMFFGGIKGMNAFYPDSVKSNIIEPQLVFTDFKLFNTSVIPGPTSPLKHHITQTKEIVLLHTQNAFSFEFAALHYSQPMKNQYAYMMENFNKKWIFTDAKHRFATYTNLDPGSYTFRVKGANSDGIWNEEGAYIKLEILPPFWQTWWFRTFVIVTIVTLIYSAYRSRIRSIEKQNEKLEKLVRERTAEVELQKEEIKAQRDDLEMQNEKIEMINEQIKSSIRYAQTIQNAILPISENMRSYFDYFTIFRPKDIVSGDFYWFSNIDNPETNQSKVFIAAVDCTGHGVPGAFMSMIGSRLLNEIVNEKRILEPNQILDNLNMGVRKALKQEQTENNEGMDVCLCMIETLNSGKTRVTYAGAKRPLFYFKQEKNTIATLKGDRKSIGGIKSKMENVPFTSKELMLNQGDLIYLTSDGIIDQNSPDRVRFGTVRFIETIEKCVRLPMNIQCETIESALDLYQQDAEQRDDITVIGIKV